jgi:hypothetical protein
MLRSSVTSKGVIPHTVHLARPPMKLLDRIVVPSSTSVTHVSQSRSRRLGRSAPLLFITKGHQQLRALLPSSRINSRRITAPQVRDEFNNSTLASSYHSTRNQTNKSCTMAWVQCRKDAILANVSSIDDLDFDVIGELSMLSEVPMTLEKFKVSNTCK